MLFSLFHFEICVHSSPLGITKLLVLLQVPAQTFQILISKKIQTPQTSIYLRLQWNKVCQNKHSKDGSGGSMFFAFVIRSEI
jgi:hypothetical protein